MEYSSQPERGVRQTRHSISFRFQNWRVMCSGESDVFARNLFFPDRACVNAAHLPHRVEGSGTGAHTGPCKPFLLLRGMEQFFHHFGGYKSRYHLGAFVPHAPIPYGADQCRKLFWRNPHF